MLKTEGIALLATIQGATAVPSWEILLYMVGTDGFGAAYP